jgi:hypothetical protein
MKPSHQPSLDAQTKPILNADDCLARHLALRGLRARAFAEPPRLFGAWTAARKVCSAKWVIDDYTFDLTSMAHVLGEQLAATECARGGYNRRIPIG